MPLVDNVKDCFRGHNAMAEVLGKLALGRPDNGRAYSREDAQQMARAVLIDLGLDWPRRKHPAK